jgi:hypothetical protein
MNLESAIAKKCWTPRAAFPPSSLLSDRLFTCGGGFYLMTTAHFGAGDPVYGVGWAESDYWARRAWIVPFREELTPPPPQWRPPPSLVFLGRPETLSYGAVRDFERGQPGAKTAILLTGTYRISVDGAFVYCSINGVDGVKYIYSSNHPKRGDQPVALEFRLPKDREGSGEDHQWRRVAVAIGVKATKYVLNAVKAGAEV